MLLRHAGVRLTRITRVRSRQGLRPTQVTYVRSREDPEGNIATLRWNDFSTPLVDRVAIVAEVYSADCQLQLRL